MTHPQPGGGLESERVAKFARRTYAVDARTVELQMRPLHGGLESTGVARVQAHFRDGNARPERQHSSLSAWMVRRNVKRISIVHSTDRPLRSPRGFLALTSLARRAPICISNTLGRASVAVARADPNRPRAQGAGRPARHCGRFGDWGCASQLGLRKGTERAGALDPSYVRAGVVGRACATQSSAALRFRTLPSHAGIATPASRTVPRLAIRLDGPAWRCSLAQRSSTCSPGGGIAGADRLGARASAHRSRTSAHGCDSLGRWEPRVRRRHDTLLQGYLAARGFDARLLPSVREAYWLAAASNSLSGALGYQLSVALDTAGHTARERVAAVAAVRQHLRVIRRADAFG